MTIGGIDRLGGAGVVLDSASRPSSASLVGAVAGEIAGRAVAWSAELSGAGAPRDGFQPDRAELGRGGDIYGLRDLASDVAGQLGASPTEEGTLRRALEEFTREVAVQVHGLSGAGEARQRAGIEAAVEIAQADGTGDGGGIEGFIARLEVATQALASQRGG